MLTRDIIEAHKASVRNFLARRYCKKGFYVVHRSERTTLTHIYRWRATRAEALVWIKAQGPLASVYSILVNTSAGIRQHSMSNYIAIDKELDND